MFGNYPTVLDGGKRRFTGRLSGLAGGQVHSCSLALRTRIPRLRSKSKANSRKSAHNAAATLNVKLESKSKNNESKTSVHGNSGAARRRWVMVRLVGLAHAGVPRIEQGRRFQKATWPTRVRPDATSSRTKSAVYGLHSGATGRVRQKGARPRRLRNNDLNRR
jgi:hypothetical protein